MKQQYVASTVKEVIAKIAGQASSPEMKWIAHRIVREHLRDEHGIVIKLKTIERISTSS